MGIYQDTSPQEIIAHFGIEMEVLHRGETFVPRNEANIREHIGISFVEKQLKEMWHIEMKKARIIVYYDENFDYSLVRVILPDNALCEKSKDYGKKAANSTQIAKLEEVMEYFGIRQEKSSVGHTCYIYNESVECRKWLLAAWKQKKACITVDYDADFDFILMRITPL